MRAALRTSLFSVLVMLLCGSLPKSSARGDSSNALNQLLTDVKNKSFEIEFYRLNVAAKIDPSQFPPNVSDPPDSRIWLNRLVIYAKQEAGTARTKLANVLQGSVPSSGLQQFRPDCCIVCKQPQEQPRSVLWLQSDPSIGK